MSVSSPEVRSIMPHTVQCTNVPPGASGSVTISAWLLVSRGRRDQASGGLTPFSAPSQGNLVGIVPPALSAGLGSRIASGTFVGAPCESSPQPAVAVAEARTTKSPMRARVRSGARIAPIVLTPSRRPGATLKAMRIFRIALSAAAACAALLALAPAASARLAVVTTGDRHVAIVDLGQKQVLARPDVGLPSRGAALTVDGARGYVVASSRSQAMLCGIDLASLTVVTRIALPDASRRVAVSADGARAYVTGGGRRGTLTVVDLVRGTVAAQIAVGRRPSAIALSPDGARAYVTTGARGLAIADLLSQRLLETVKVGRGPYAIAVP